MKEVINIRAVLNTYKSEMEDELSSILHYWQQVTIDKVNGGFYGKINNSNQPEIEADKGVVLNARILWTFSAAYNLQREKTYLATAERAYNYLVNYFKDDVNGGVYWSVNARGKMKESRKQIYGLAFCIYGLSEYYLASQNEAALVFAKELYNAIEQHSFDKINNGYFEAFACDWQPLQDVRLSAKDANASKTMNTHLHVIEAYANLYKVWKNGALKQRIENLLMLFHQHFINQNTKHLALFFNENWDEVPDVISYGHDIEAAWLLLDCAMIIDNKPWLEIYQKHAQTIAVAAAEGLDKDGGLWYEYEPITKKLIKEKHWWPQAEAMIGFLNAWKLSGDGVYLQQSINAWNFTRQYLLDKENGEWFWGVDEAHHIMPGEDKTGFWKCPYHNSRACIQVINICDYSIVHM